MANNRMYLICLHCLNDPAKRMEDSQFYLAKYYPPPTGWYTIYRDSAKEFADRLDDFFDHHKHGETWEESMYGGCFTVITETSLDKAGDEFVQDKRGILEQVTKAAAQGKAGQ